MTRGVKRYFPKKWGQMKLSLAAPFWQGRLYDRKYLNRA